MRKHLTTTLFLLLLSGCADDGKKISAQIEAQFEAGSSAPINLALVGPSTWERVCFLGPYTMNEHAEKVLGFKWDATGKTSIGESEGINVLAFVQGHEVIAYAEHPRNKGDFSQVKPPCLAREQAVLDRQSGKDGWVYLVSRQQDITSHQ